MSQALLIVEDYDYALSKEQSVSELGARAMILSTTLFWVNSQQAVVITYPRFGTTYRFHLRPEGTDTVSRNVGKE
jgi:hypothetical protein